MPELPTEYHVRDVRVFPNVVLAPMEGVTDLPFRRLIRGIGGVGLSCTEFAASEALKRGVGKMLDLTRFDPDERPVSVQIYGRDPQSMAEAARIVQERGATICDINMGCPSRKVVAHSGGSALMKDPALARDIVRAVRAAIDIPLTVKMRAGFSAGQRNAPEIAHICEEEGAEALTVHWRTREDQYGGVRKVDMIAAVKATVSVPVIGNGDVVDVPSAVRMFEETGVDGVMIGRGAMRNPWVLKQVAQHLAGEPVLQVTAADRRATLLRFVANLKTEVDVERYILGRFKQVCRYFTKGLYRGAEARTLLLTSQSLDEIVDNARDYFGRLECWERGDHRAFDGWG